MKRIIFLVLLIMPFMAKAQRIEVAADKHNVNYLTVYAYGLPREIVKTNSQMRASVYGDSGIARRHHTTKGEDEAVGDEGYVNNSKISFAFMIAPYNVDIDGEHTESSEGLTWTKASGWDSSIDDVDAAYVSGDAGKGAGDSPIAATPTGCAAYTGLKDDDTPGEWRLPTQREMQVMFTVIEQAIQYSESGVVESSITNGEYWTSTEFCNPGIGSKWKVWTIDNSTGFTTHNNRDSYTKKLTRCIKDIYEPINEQ